MLRSDSKLAEQYAELKRILRSVTAMTAKHIEGKDDFVTAVLAEAGGG